MHDSRSDHISEILEKPLNGMGYDLVRVQLSGKVRLKLQVMIDRLDESTVTMDDCVMASRYISSLLDVEDPIDAPYDLDVTSPGMDRPLTRPKDFERFTQQKIKVKTIEALEGRKRFQGLLSETTNDAIKLVSDEFEKPIEIRFDNIQKAKIIPDFEN